MLVCARSQHLSACCFLSCRRGAFFHRVIPRLVQASEALANLKQAVDTLIVIPNQKLLHGES